MSGRPRSVPSDMDIQPCFNRWTFLYVGDQGGFCDLRNATARSGADIGFSAALSRIHRMAGASRVCKERKLLAVTTRGLHSDHSTGDRPDEQWHGCKRDGLQRTLA